jgi:proton glutamate symport protein
MIALILAVIAGMYFKELTLSIWWMWVLFMKLLKTFLAPLLFFSVLTAVLGLWDMKKLWSIGLRTIGYYILTTTIAITTSLFLMNVFKPWEGVSFDFENFSPHKLEALSFSGFLLSIIPDNIMVAFIDLNAMQIVTMGIILWVALISYGKREEVLQLKTLTQTINNGILIFISWVIKLTPIWVFAIVSWVVAQSWVESIIKLLPFAGVSLLGLAIHALITLPSIGYFLWWFHPLKYFLKVKEAILVAFSTSSSSATMWVSMKVAKENAKLSHEVVEFTFPIGTTVNMDGTALYQAWAALFISQVVWIDLSFAQQITIVVMIILASIWAAGIPGAGILILTTVFLSIWLPIEAIWIILAVDRLLDMFRTAVNVWWDLLTAKVIDSYYSNHLDDWKSEKLKLKVITQKN